MKLKRILCAVLAMLLLTGCGIPGLELPRDMTPDWTWPQRNDDPTETKEPTQVAQTVPPTEPAELAGVNPLSFRASSESPEIFVLDDHTAAFLIPEYASGDYSRKLTHIQIIDLYTDELVAETVMEEALCPLPLSVGGTLVLGNEERGTVYLLDRQLQQLAEFQAETVTGVVTGDLQNYYYIYASELFKTDIPSGKTEAVELDWDLPLEAITGYDDGQGLLLVNAYSDPYATDTCVGAIDLNTGTYRLVSDDPTGAQLTSNGVLMMTDDPLNMTADAVYLPWENQRQYALPELLANNNEYSTTHIAGSDYIFQVCYDKRQITDVQDTRLLQLGDMLTSVSLQDYLKGKKLNDFAALPGGNLLALAVTRRGYQPFLICPDKLAFTLEKRPAASDAVLVDENIRNRYQLVQTGSDLPGALRQYRQRADELEEEFGVTILISSQCAAPAAVSSLKITTSDKAGLENEAELIDYALDELEAALEHYPVGFFRQFKNGAQERGVLFLLVEDIGAEMNAVGVSYRMGQWYPIAVDITSWALESTYYHEIWHATEFKINDEDPNLLTDAQWSQYNPPGFLYTQDQTGAFEEDLAYTLFGEQGDSETHFVDGYGKTFAYEDRARIMEYVMYSDRYARLIVKKPAMRQKLTAMADAIRAVFDTEGWGKTLWEKYL